MRLENISTQTYWIVLPCFFVLWILGGWALKKVLFAWVKKFADRTESKIDDVILAAADLPVMLLVVVSGLSVAHHLLIPKTLADQLTPFFPDLLKVLTVLSFILFVDSLIEGMIVVYGAKNEFLKISRGLLTGLTHLLVYGVGLLIILDSVGISVTPIIASLGIGSLAVALALQPTLQNLFAGFQIVIDQPVKPGQFIKLESGEEGYVQKVGWRSTWIQQLTGNMVIIPNSSLLNSRLLNYHYPATDLAVTVEVGVHYSSDLEKVEKITCEVGEDIMRKIQGGIPEFKPLVRFHTFAASSINFTAVLRGREFVDNYLIKHEFIKALSTRFAKEGIMIPYPVVALNSTQEKAELFHPTGHENN